MPASNDATASYLGYIFQGQYALLALWDAMDDDAAVSVESDDDVTLDGHDPRLAQLKHSMGTPAALTITNVGFWKTIRIWAQHVQSDPAARDGSVDRTKYLFVTVAEVAEGDALQALVRRDPQADLDAVDVEVALTAEATRVRDERATAAGAGGTPPHRDRAAGCEAFLALDADLRRRLVSRIEILPGSFRITDVQHEVERRLQRAGTVRTAIRTSVAERLIERWDRQVTLALMRRRDREIGRAELQGMIEDLIHEHSASALTNDFGARLPDANEYAAAEGSMLHRQIMLVDGGASRLERAIRDRWRARNQRGRWTDDDASLVPLLKEFDDSVREAWSDLHGPMRHDCDGREESERQHRGRELLDWAHHTAPTSVRPPRPNWSQAFYVRGVLQQLADDLEVGWHPDYRERLAPPTVQPSGPELSDGAGSGGDVHGDLPSTATARRPDDIADQLPPERPVSGSTTTFEEPSPRRSRRSRPAKAK